MAVAIRVHPGLSLAAGAQNTVMRMGNITDILRLYGRSSTQAGCSMVSIRKSRPRIWLPASRCAFAAHRLHTRLPLHGSDIACGHCVGIPVSRARSPSLIYRVAPGASINHGASRLGQMVHGGRAIQRKRLQVRIERSDPAPDLIVRLILNRAVQIRADELCPSEVTDG